MAVQLDGKATEKQRKYLGYLSSQGKERFGKDFSIRKMAEEQGIDWEEMSVEEANKLIKEVKEMIEKTEASDFSVDLVSEITEEVTKKAQEEEKRTKEEKPDIYMMQIIASGAKIAAIKLVLDAMGVGYIVLQEVRA